MSPRPGKSLVIFDFDGTLVDSFDATVELTNRVLTNNGLSAVSTAHVIEGMQFDTNRRFAFHSGVTDDDRLSTFADEYYALLKAETHRFAPVPSIVEVLTELQAMGVVLGVYSNNMGEVIRKVLSERKLESFFKFVVGDGDGYPLKPSRDGLVRIATGMDVDPYRVAYIGDGESDAVAARAAGCFSIGVTEVNDRHGKETSAEFVRTVRVLQHVPDLISRWIEETLSTGDSRDRPYRLYFMRHCESEANRTGILASRQDFPLSERGHQQARTIAGQISGRFVIERIVSSPLRRALQSAQHIGAALDIPVEVSPLITEQELGVFAGLSNDELKHRGDYRHDKADRWGWRPESGETYLEIYERVRRFFDTTLSPDGARGTLVVCHAIALRLVRAFLENTAPRYPLEIAANGDIWETDYWAPGKEHKIREHVLIETDYHGE